MAVLGFVLGLAAGIGVGLACMAIVGGLTGLIMGLCLGAAAYLGVSLLFSSERRLRGRAVSEIPEGDKAAAVIDAARAANEAVAMVTRQVADPAIHKQAQDFVEATRGLIGYTEENPATFRVLRHFIDTYAGQARQLLETYLDIERSGADAQLTVARSETFGALVTLEKTAAGELSRAVASDALSLKASAAAIDKLASMDGYDAQGRAAAEAAAGGGASTPAEVPVGAEASTSTNRAAAPEPADTRNRGTAPESISTNAKGGSR